MKDINKIISSQYDFVFDEIRKKLIVVSYYKYGDAKNNFGYGRVDAVKSLELCLKKYKETGNTEYLCDVANYAMFEFKYPMHSKAHFRHTDSNESAGKVGKSINEESGEF